MYCKMMTIQTQIFLSEMYQNMHLYMNQMP